MFRLMDWVGNGYPLDEDVDEEKEKFIYDFVKKNKGDILLFVFDETHIGKEGSVEIVLSNIIFQTKYYVSLIDEPDYVEESFSITDDYFRKVDGKNTQEDLKIVKEILIKHDFNHKYGKDIWLGAFSYFVDKLAYSIFSEVRDLENPPEPPRKKMFGIF